MLVRHKSRYHGIPPVRLQTQRLISVPFIGYWKRHNVSISSSTKCSLVDRNYLSSADTEFSASFF